ncbi:MAG: ribonuclease III [Clostridiales bacterium]|jgi:ribonuclease-3|nr:ribonuclease III [Clostridiales bacterium]
MYEKFYGILEYTFQQPSLLEKALTHSSYAHEKGLDSEEHNERLEFLGDAVLELAISETLYRKFPHFSEGQLTKFRASLVCESSLAKVARKIDVESFLKLGKGEEGAGGRHRDALLADAFEAVLGAVYLDGGLSPARRLIELFLIPEIQPLQDRFEFTDYKTFLQESLQKSSREPLQYVITNETGPDHDKTFTANVTHQGKLLGSGSGKSKKEAEQSAALNAIQKLGLPAVSEN